MKINNYYDSFNYVFFGIYFVVCLALIAITLFLKVNTTYVIVGIIELIVITILMIFFYVKAYFLQKDKLVIRTGFIRKEIPYKSIKKCYVVKNINPFYSTSIKRLAIKLKNGKEIYISPVKMDNVLMKIIRKVEL